MITVIQKNREPIGALENAYAISYEKPWNEIPLASFSLPLDDPKNALCTPLNYVEIVDDNYAGGRYIGLFRIMPSLTVKDSTDNVITYECQHVLSTLLDDVLFGYRQFSNWTTRNVLEALLNEQTTKHWALGACAFTRYFHYGFQDENGIIGPIFSTAEPLDEPYEWTYDTQAYPWTLGLERPSNEVKGEIRYGKNMRAIDREIDPSNVTNRIYPKGAGEGVNQLTIKDVNGGVPYLENAESIAEYGLRSYIWVDNRFEVDTSLKAYAKSLLDEWSTPKVTYRISAADLSSLPGFEHEIIEVGDLIRIIDPDFGEIEARVVKESKSDLNGEPYAITYEIANRLDDITTNQANLERKQQVNEVYSQGSTNIMPFDYQDNADENNPAVIRFFIPEDVLNINTLDLTFETEQARTYSKATGGGGAVVKSTGSGGGTNKTTGGGGGTATTSGAGGNHRHMIASYSSDPSSTLDKKRYYTRSQGDGGFNIALDIESSNTGDLYTQGASGNHTHTITLNNHTHQFTTDPHAHEITIPDHTHGIKHGIFKLGSTPSQVSIEVDGNPVPHNGNRATNLDLIPYLAKNSNGKVRRGAWHEVSIKPNGLGRINANVITRLFIQSHIGGNY
ncbi:phage tail spike protein [Paraliobacillus salinarum]|uniref:phage tail spike protein n=1 Tax=Paraliobacillus salinarum TaxID=1158996 RepID=UPI0015F456FF|nr:phage tail spike protein [Paraliobacillus salinarum]